MDVIPAIDLLDGRCVRLRHGDFDAVSRYPAEPSELACQYAAAGAQWLHVVDLAASRDGGGADTGPLFRLLGNAPQAVQTGGGVRGEDDLRARLDAGAARVVIGSLCVTATGQVIEWLGAFGAERIVAALDVRLDPDGTPVPRIHGWTEGSATTLWALLDRLAPAGLRHLLVTDISRDGALAGPNLDLYIGICRRYPTLALQASGGVSQLADLAALKRTGAHAAITGKAILEGRFSVAEALEAAA